MFRLQSKSWRRERTEIKIKKIRLEIEKICLLKYIKITDKEDEREIKKTNISKKILGKYTPTMQKRRKAQRHETEEENERKTRT